MTSRSCSTHQRLAWIWVLVLLGWLAHASQRAGTAQKAESSPEPDPTRGEVPLPAENGWNAFLVHDAGVGVWAVRAVPFCQPYGNPQIVGLDDMGRCSILYGYSGKWSPLHALHDGHWLSAMDWIDLDPRLPGPELYVGGKRGRLYQVHRQGEGGVEVRVVNDFRGEEIYTLVGGALRPDSGAPAVLLVFTKLGRTFLVDVPSDASHGSFRIRQIGRVPGRVRDAVKVGPIDNDGAPWVATASHASEVALVRLTANDRLERRVIVTEPMGFGRLALRPPVAGANPVLYAGRDDGVLLRLERKADGAWQREMIYAGPQGIRGVAAGRFYADPGVESVAVYGYSGKVQLVSRRSGQPWRVETIFRDRDKGHALAVAELDGRNATREIVGSGYGSRIFLLSREPGYGLQGVPVDPDPQDASDSGETTADQGGIGRPGDSVKSAMDAAQGPSGSSTPGSGGPPPLRVAIQGRPVPVSRLSPLKYAGGFETKALVYETLVRRDETGRIVPLLASSWSIEDEGRAVVFTLRDGARFHDGSPVTASAVVQHFRRWVGLPEHGWLGASRHIQSVTASGDRSVRITLERAYALLPDLCAMNPCAILGPGAYDRHGNFLKPMGTGPFRFVCDRDQGRVLEYERVRSDGASPASPARVQLVHLSSKGGADPVDLLEKDQVQVMVDGWMTRVPRDRLAVIQHSKVLRCAGFPGSCVVHLNFNLKHGPCADRGLRQFIASRIDRKELIREVEKGHAVPCRSWAAPTVQIWPRSRFQPKSPSSPPRLDRPLVMLARINEPGELAVARAMARQLEAAGLGIRVRDLGDDEHRKSLAAGDYDLALDRTWGVPWDPWITLAARFRTPPEIPSAGSHKFTGVLPALAELVEQAAAEPALEGRMPVYRKIQDLMDREAVLVPLFVPERLAVVHGERPLPRIDHDLCRLDLTPLTDR